MDRLNFTWDANTATVVLVLGALAFLFLVNLGFRGFNVSLGA